MTPQDLADMYGTHQNIADRLGIDRVSVTLWFKRGFVPLPRQAQYQLISRGRLRAELPMSRQAREDID